MCKTGACRVVYFNNFTVMCLYVCCLTPPPPPPPPSMGYRGCNSIRVRKMQMLGSLSVLVPLKDKITSQIYAPQDPLNLEFRSLNRRKAKCKVISESVLSSRALSFCVQVTIINKLPLCLSTILPISSISHFTYEVITHY